MVAFGEQTIPSGITALLIAIMPVWVAILGRIFLGERLPRVAIVGIVVGFVGVAILVGPSAFGGTGALDPLGLAAVLFSPIAWSSGSLFASHRAVLPQRPLVATGVQMLLGGLVLAVDGRRSPASSRPSTSSAISRESVVALVYLLVIGQPRGVHRLRLAAARRAAAPRRDLRLRQPGRRRHPGRASSSARPIDPRTIVAGAVIVFAVALIVTARGRMQAPRAGRASEAAPTDVPAPSVAPAPAPTPAPTR